MQHKGQLPRGNYRPENGPAVQNKEMLAVRQLSVSLATEEYRLRNKGVAASAQDAGYTGCWLSIMVVP